MPSRSRVGSRLPLSIHWSYTCTGFRMYGYCSNICRRGCKCKPLLRLDALLRLLRHYDSPSFSSRVCGRSKHEYALHWPGVQACTPGGSARSVHDEWQRSSGLTGISPYCRYRWYHLRRSRSGACFACSAGDCLPPLRLRAGMRHHTVSVQAADYLMQEDPDALMQAGAVRMLQQKLDQVQDELTGTTTCLFSCGEGQLESTSSGNQLRILSLLQPRCQRIPN